MNERDIGIYVASPCGFSPELYLPCLKQTIIPALKKAHRKIYVLNPWASEYGQQLASCGRIRQKQRRVSAYHEVDMDIGRDNRDMIDESRLVFAILNGSDVDSGTAAEVAYGCATGKPVLGFRDDFKPAGENEGVKVNLQVQYFIEESGGWIIEKSNEISSDLRKILCQKKII